jgi:hypothetical protein
LCSDIIYISLLQEKSNVVLELKTKYDMTLSE